MITIREASAADVHAIREIFLATYGHDYSHPQYYDPERITRLVYADDNVLLVAVDEEGRVRGTASVLLQIGAHNDLVGEFGRLAVHPDARGEGIGRRLMEERLARVQDRLHVGLVENRVAHPFSQKISARHGFVSVGFLPWKRLMAERECVALYCQHFGDAVRLRKNHPRVVPEVSRLAELCLQHCGIEADAIVDERSAAYPPLEDFVPGEFVSEGYSALLRFERGRVTHREVFGPMRLHYGLFQLQARRANYLTAEKDGQIVGAVGFIRDPVERTVRIFELVSRDDGPLHFLLSQLVERCDRAGDCEYMEVDVAADAPRMQRTLIELGFLPAAYVPAMVFADVERLDVVKLARVTERHTYEGIVLAETTKPVANLVIEQFTEQMVAPEIAAHFPTAPLFTNLTDEQRSALARPWQVRSYSADEVVFDAGTPSECLYMVLDGSIEVVRAAGPPIVMRPGELFGEMSLLTQQTHSATARAAEAAHLAILCTSSLQDLIRRRTDIGLVLYRNLAAGLSARLRGEAT